MQTQYIIGAVILLLAILLVVIITIALKKKKSSQTEDTIENQIYVGNLPYRIREQEIKSFFSEFGVVEEAKIVKNIKTGRSRGYAFVTFATGHEANQALKSHGQRVNGRKIIVRIAKIPRKSIPMTY